MYYPMLLSRNLVGAFDNLVFGAEVEIAWLMRYTMVVQGGIMMSNY